jgi:lysyl-tRNA synthetase class 1
MARTIHWADVIVENILKKCSRPLVTVEIIPSHEIDIEDMRGLIIADAIYRSLSHKDVNADLFCIVNNSEPLKEVDFYDPNLSANYAKHLGKPISEIPCPCGNCENYAEHFLKSFLRFFRLLGISPKIYRTAELYRAGKYTEVIKTALQKSEEIKKILEACGKPVLKVQDWSPFNPECGKCGRITAAKVTDFDLNVERVNYVCACGHSGTVHIAGGGILDLNISRFARYAVFQAAVEPLKRQEFSKQEYCNCERRMAKEIFGQDIPRPVLYEKIVSGRQGRIFSPGETPRISNMLDVTPPEVLRYLFIRAKPGKLINFDPGQDLLRLTDEYEKLGAEYRKNSQNQGIFEKRIYELSRIAGACQFEVSFKQMLVIYQAARGDFEQILSILKRSGYSTENEKCLNEFVGRVSRWLELYSSRPVKLNIREKVPVQAATLSEIQRTFLEEFAAIIDARAQMSAEEYHMLIYSVVQKNSEFHRQIKEKLKLDNLDINPKDLFKAIYISILGQSSGPRAGWFLSSFKKDFLVQRFREASTYSPGISK